MALIEVSAYSAQWAIDAQKNGASRVELCANIMEGGTSPSIGCIQLTREALNIDLFIIVRPRGGNFFYTPLEFETMARDIEQIKIIGADGIVIGLLDAENQIDIGRTQALVKLAKPMQVTFHRAFDLVKDPYLAMENVIKTGCNRILTSGLKATALEGIELLKELKNRSKGRITILPGSGINENNIFQLWQEGGFNEFHLSAKKKQFIQGIKPKTEVNFNLNGDSEENSYVLDNEQLIKVVEKANGFN